MIKRDYDTELPVNNPEKAIKSICNPTPYYHTCFRYISNSLYKNKSSKINSSQIFSISLHTAINELQKITYTLKSYNSPSDDQSTPSQCEYMYFNSSVSQLNSYLVIDEEKNSTAMMTMRSEMIDWLAIERPKIAKCLYWLEYNKGLDTENANNFLMILANMNSISEMFNPSINSVFNFSAFRSSGKSIAASLFSDRVFVDTRNSYLVIKPCRLGLPTFPNTSQISIFPICILMESMNLVKGYDKVNPSEDLASSSTRRAAHKRRLTIALSLTLFLTLLICALVGAFIHASNSEYHTPSVSSNSTDSLKIVCAVTQHPGSCFDSISSLHKNPHKPDPEQFLNLSLQATVKELTNVTSLPKTLISKVNDPGTVSALKDCISLFDDALSQLNQSAELMSVGPGESALTVMKVNNMQTWISAAMTDQDTCLEGLDEMGSPLLGEVKARVQNAKEYMSNTLAILNTLILLVIAEDCHSIITLYQKNPKVSHISRKFSGTK
ncbi:hypothetical protein RND71_017700 [Anisodus tanguticus]|uniref:pectinesterase n=1 Tax=Anisodus tanguticus TaxID=243964 RepID=A0AAE1S127_9SOLA|nr:hypothetical protein RND71_017700 [Anisodus tanguticus]